MSSPYRFHFKLTYRNEEGHKITEEFDMDFGTANPELARQKALVFWSTSKYSGLEVTGPYHYSTDWWKFSIMEEYGPIPVGTGYSAVSPHCQLDKSI